MRGVGTLHALVMIALVPITLGLVARFLAGGTDRKGVLIDALLVAVIAWAFWSPAPCIKTGYGLFGYTAFLAVAMLTLILRWARSSKASRAAKANGSPE